MLSATDRNALLSRWIKPSSDDEKTQQDRAERLVRLAIKESASFDGSDIRIYTKGSYPNNTNVRRDSDVDVVVEMNDCLYSAPKAGVTLLPKTTSSYRGIWTPSVWRATVKSALVAYFGASSVDSTGKVAINITAVPGSRPSADVVPSFAYRRYDNADRSDYEDGSTVFQTDNVTQIVNWPQQQLVNGRSLNMTTGGRYKNFVRALKNAENVLSAAGTIKDLPSYFMECLVYNVPAATLSAGDLASGFKATLAHLYQALDSSTAYQEWVEPNRMKWLFRGHQKWTVDDAKLLVLATWRHLGYGS